MQQVKELVQKTKASHAFHSHPKTELEAINVQLEQVSEIKTVAEKLDQLR